MSPPVPCAIVWVWVCVPCPLCHCVHWQSGEGRRRQQIQGVQEREKKKKATNSGCTRLGKEEKSHRFMVYKSAFTFLNHTRPSQSLCKAGPVASSQPIGMIQGG